MKKSTLGIIGTLVLGLGALAYKANQVRQDNLNEEEVIHEGGKMYEVPNQEEE